VIAQAIRHMAIEPRSVVHREKQPVNFHRDGDETELSRCALVNYDTSVTTAQRMPA
jgi:hypothetical protein